MADVGIFTTEQEKQLATWLDELVKLKGLWEIVDGYVFKAIIVLLDDKLIVKLNETLKTKLAALVTAAMAEDVPLAEQLATDVINGLVDIPGLDEDTEGLILKSIVELIVGTILQKLAVVKGAPIKLQLKKKVVKKAKNF